MKRNETLEQRCRRVVLIAGYDYPFFLMPAGNVKYVSEPGLGTMGVHVSGVIRVDPEFVDTLNDSQLQACLCHELMHLLMLHSDRLRGYQDVERIQIAQDMAINQSLRLMKLELPTGVYYPPRGHESKSSEELYELLPPTPPEQQGQKQQPMVGRGCGVLQRPADGSGDEEGQEPGEGENGSGAGALTPSEAHNEEIRKWQGIAAQARALSAGTEAGKVLAGLVTPPEPKVRWEQVLRGCAAKALAHHGRDEQTWSRRARRQPAGVILPGWQACKAQIAVVIDTSGSMSDEALARCVAETLKIGQLAGVAIYLVTHDAAVQWSGWLHATKPERIQRSLKGRGGTVFQPAYAAVEQARGRFDVCIHLTDGECFGNWPNPPENARKFVAALIGKHGSPRPSGSLTIQVET